MLLHVGHELGGVFLQSVLCQQRAWEYLYNAAHAASYGYKKR